MPPAPLPRRARCRRESAREPPPHGRVRAGRSIRPWSVVLLERPHFDRHTDGAREFAPPCQCGVEIGRLEQRDAADLLLALDERTIGGNEVAALLTKHGCGIWRCEAAAEDPHARRL